MSYMGFMRNTVDAIKGLYNDALYNSKKIMQSDKDEYKRLLEFFRRQYEHGDLPEMEFKELYSELTRYDITRIAEERKRRN